VQTEVLSLHFTIMAGLLALISAMLCVIASLLTVMPQQVAEDTIFHADTMQKNPSLLWWQDYRLYSTVLVLLAILLIVMHW
jgi:hypothetical protein